MILLAHASGLANITKIFEVDRGKLLPLAGRFMPQKGRTHLAYRFGRKKETKKTEKKLALVSLFSIEYSYTSPEALRHQNKRQASHLQNRVLPDY